MNEQEIVRRQKLEKLRELGIDPYPADEFKITHTAAELKREYRDDHSEWFYDISIGILFIFASKKVIEDLTLMAATRRTINLLYKEKQNIGFMLGAIIIIKCCIWDGAERFVIYFENELKGNARKVLTIIIVSGIQMATWTKLYSLLYDACYSIFMNA